MAGSMAGTDDEDGREAVAVSMQLLAEMVDTVAVNTEPKHLPVPKRLEESVAALAAMHGLPWRKCHITYRNSVIRWALCQAAVSARVRADGSLSHIHLETAVRAICQLSGTPVVSCTFVGAHFMAENGHFHQSAAQRRPGPESGCLSVCGIPPDGLFEMVRYTFQAGTVHSGSPSSHDLTRQKHPDEAETLSITRLPVSICAFARERQEGHLFSLHVRLRITEDYKQIRRVRCVVPLHPSCLTGSIQMKTSAGRAQEESVLAADGSYIAVVSWEIQSVGIQADHTEETESIECVQEATLDVDCAIVKPMMTFPAHAVTEEDLKCVPAMSLQADAKLWEKWNAITSSMHILDQMKKPFPRDRTTVKMQQRQHLQQLKDVCESRLVSSCLSRALPPISVRIGRAFGPCFNGLAVSHCSILSTPYPAASSSSDILSESMHEETLLADYGPFAHGTSNDLSCPELLFDLQPTDFRKEQLDFDVPVIVFQPEKPSEKWTDLNARADAEAAELGPIGRTQSNVSQKKNKKKVQETKGSSLK